MHHIKPTAETLHGVFSNELTPVLQIQPGETVRFTTYDSGWHSYDADRTTRWCITRRTTRRPAMRCAVRFTSRGRSRG